MKRLMTTVCLAVLVLCVVCTGVDATVIAELPGVASRTNVSSDPRSYSLGFQTFISIAVNTPFVVFTELFLQVVDGASDGVTVTPLQPLLPPEDSDGNTEILTASIGSGGVFTSLEADIGDGTPGTVNLGPINGPLGGPWDTLRLEYSFQLSGNFDTAILIGSVRLETPPVIPEPSTYLLFAVGLLSTLGMSYRQRKKAA